MAALLRQLRPPSPTPTSQNSSGTPDAGKRKGETNEALLLISLRTARFRLLPVCAVSQVLGESDKVRP